MAVSRVVRHKLEGDQTISNDALVLHGMVIGSVTVDAGGYLQLNGTVTRDVAILSGGTAEINGTVRGDVRNEGGQVRVHGVVLGRLHRTAGSTYVHPEAVIKGQHRD